jgi:hypothetical protein
MKVVEVLRMKNLRAARKIGSGLTLIHLVTFEESVVAVAVVG